MQLFVYAVKMLWCVKTVVRPRVFGRFFVLNRYFEERFDIESGKLGYMSSYTAGLSFVVQVRTKYILFGGGYLHSLFFRIPARTV